MYTVRGSEDDDTHCKGDTVRRRRHVLLYNQWCVGAVVSSRPR